MRRKLAMYLSAFALLAVLSLSTASRWMPVRFHHGAPFSLPWTEIYFRGFTLNLNRLSPLATGTGSSSRSFLIGHYQCAPAQFALAKRLDSGGFDIYCLHESLFGIGYSLSDVTGPGYDLYLTNVVNTTLSFSTWPLIALFATLLALFRFRNSVWRSRRKQGLCVACGYSLTGNTSGVCPECGTTTERSPAR